MFSYYGSKSKIIDLYPSPDYEDLYEVFAGSARYALKYAEKSVTLIEIDPVIAGIWKWIIGATESDVLDLPDLKVGDDIRRIDGLTQVERDLLGFAANASCSFPRNIVTPRADKTGNVGRSYRPNSDCTLLKKRIIENLPRVRHWKVLNIDYRSVCFNPESTWFVDPPYSGPAGRGYVYNGVDYENLGAWCRSRRGQVIVCEGGGADWLPFRPLPTGHNGNRRRLDEVVYIQRNNEPCAV